MLVDDDSKFKRNTFASITRQTFFQCSNNRSCQYATIISGKKDSTQVSDFFIGGATIKWTKLMYSIIGHGYINEVYILTSWK